MPPLHMTSHVPPQEAIAYEILPTNKNHTYLPTYSSGYSVTITCKVKSTDTHTHTYVCILYMYIALLYSQLLFSDKENIVSLGELSTTHSSPHLTLPSDMQTVSNTSHLSNGRLPQSGGVCGESTIKWNSSSFSFGGRWEQT